MKRKAEEEFESLPPTQEDNANYFKLLEELKPLRWNLKNWTMLSSKKAKDAKTADRKEIVRISALLAPIAPNMDLRTMFEKNVENLSPFVDVFPKAFEMEGKNCCCDDGKIGNCKRFAWNCQWTPRGKCFMAQRSRCKEGSKLVYTASNDVV